MLRHPSYIRQQLPGNINISVEQIYIKTFKIISLRICT